MTRRGGEEERKRGGEKKKRMVELRGEERRVGRGE